jgi:hypothetical protein
MSRSMIAPGVWHDNGPARPYATPLRGSVPSVGARAIQDATPIIKHRTGEWVNARAAAASKKYRERHPGV